jgi:citrate synthase
MTTRLELPPQPHIEHLRKEAKQRFAALKLQGRGARLADAQYRLARDYGFSNWRALKEEVLRRMGMRRPASFISRRFVQSSLTADEELEADASFVAGAAATGIGMIAALVAAIMALLMLQA